MTNAETYLPGLVSVVTPTYNRAPLLAEAIESVIAQTYPSWELLIVDDGSTDDTEQVVSAYLSDSRIRYWRQQNAGQSAARNRALHFGRGEFVSLLDSDNRWQPDALALLVAAIREHAAAAVVYGQSLPIDLAGNRLPGQQRQRFSGQITSLLLLGNFVESNSVIIRRAVFDRVGHYDESLRSGEDYDLWLRLSLAGPFFHLPEHIADYRVAGERISSDFLKNYEANERILKRFLGQHRDRLAEWPVRAAWSRFFARRAREFWGNGSRSSAMLDSVRSIAWNVTGIHGWRTLAAVTLKPSPVARGAKQ